MPEHVKKFGSLFLGIGALSLLLFNAGMNQACSGDRRDRTVTQVAAPPPGSAPEPAASVSAPEPAASAQHPAAFELFDPDCEEKRDPYMHATKAPVMPVRPCKKPASNAKQAP